MSAARRVLALLLLAAVASGCGGGGEPPDGEARLSVFASIEPLRYFVERIAGDTVNVHVLVTAGQSPATYEPTAAQLAKLAEARLFFAVGVPMERQLIPRIRRTFEDVTVVDTRAGMELVPIRHTAATRGESGDRRSPPAHEHSEFDPHVWLDPKRARIIAENVYLALTEAAPRREARFFRNYRRLEDDLIRLEGEIESILAPVEGKQLFVFHPAFGYFAAAFGLEQVAIETGGVGPGSRRLAEVMDMVRERGVEAIFVQPQFSSATAAAVAAAVGAEVVTLDPLAPDYIANMKKMAADIRRALSPD